MTPARAAAGSRAGAGRPLLALTLVALGSAACGHAWDDYDPRLGTGGATSSGGSAGTTTTSTTATGGAGGTTIAGGGGAGGATITGGGGAGGTTTTSTTSTGGGPVCAPGTTMECYTGPDGTKDVGICKHGTQTCDDQGAGYGPCTGDVKPIVEDCANAADDDCNAAVNDHCGVWAKRFGDNGDQLANAVAIDGSGNVLVVGRAEETINFGGQDLDAGGSSSAFVVKLTKDGAHVWSHLYGDSAFQEASAVAADSGGNVYVAGTFFGSISFDGGATSLLSVGAQDVFVVKLDSTGAQVWAKAFTGPGAQNARGIGVDANGNIYVTGSFDGTANFLGTMATSNSQLDGFLVKLTSTGGLSWAKTFGGSGDDEGTAVAPRQSSVVVTGYFDTTINFGGSNINAFSGVDAFVAKYSSSGAYDFAKGYASEGDQHPRSASTDSNGNIFLFGDFTQKVSFGGGSQSSAGGTDVFAAKLDNEGDSQWTKTFGDAADQGAGWMALDGSGDLAAAVHHRGAVDYGGGALVAAGVAPAGDVAVARLGGGSGSYQWSRRFGDASDQDPRGLAIDSTKNVYVVGGLYGAASFGPVPILSAGKSDVFVAKLAP